MITLNANAIFDSFPFKNLLVAKSITSSERNKMMYTSEYNCRIDTNYTSIVLIWRIFFPISMREASFDTGFVLILKTYLPWTVFTHTDIVK